MSKFNSVKEKNVTKNLAGGVAFKSSAKLEIASLLLTSFLTDKYYETADDTINRLTNLSNELDDKQFLAKASIYARDKYRMRSVSHVCSAIIAETVHGEEWLKRYYDKVIMRVDDMTETLSYFWRNGKKPIPNSMKKGFSMAFGRFDEYQLAKYQAKNKELSLVDLMRLVHPKKTDKNASGLEKLVKGTLVNTDTWEAKLSSVCNKNMTDEQKQEAKRRNWAEFVNKDENKIEMFALIRNLRNIWSTGDKAVQDRVCYLLTNPANIHRSKILPLRYATAYKELKSLENADKLRGALSKAAEIALDNVPEFDGSTALLIDVSGSMHGQPAEVASIFGAALYKKNFADVILFDNSVRHINANPADSLFTIAKAMSLCGGGTDFGCAIRALKDKFYDRVIILSDMQSWIGDGWTNSCQRYFNYYRKTVNPECKLYSFDLRGYGTLQMPERNIYCLAGFSENTFDLMLKLDTGVSNLINEIESVII